MPGDTRVAPDLEAGGIRERKSSRRIIEKLCGYVKSAAVVKKTKKDRQSPQDVLGLAEFRGSDDERSFGHFLLRLDLIFDAAGS